MSSLNCSNSLRIRGLPYPRTCAKCGLGPCKHPDVFKLPEKPAEPLTFSVEVAIMKESHRVTYWVILFSSARPKDAKIFDRTGKLEVYQTEYLNRANYTAQEYADFLGVPFTPLEVEGAKEDL